MNGCFYQILFLQINLKEYGFCATYSFTIIVSELKYKNNLQSRESQKKKKKNLKLTIIMYMFMFYYEIPLFYQDFKNENLLLFFFLICTQFTQ